VINATPMNHLVARPSEVTQIKRARRVRDTHPAEALDVQEQVAMTAECQASMEYGHRPVHVMILFEVYTTAISVLSKSDLAAGEKPFFQRSLQQMIAIFPSAFTAKATHCTLALRLHCEKPRLVGFEKRHPKVDHPSNRAWLFCTDADHGYARARTGVASDPCFLSLDDAPEHWVLSWWGDFPPKTQVDQRSVGNRTFPEHVVPQNMQ